MLTTYYFSSPNHSGQISLSMDLEDGEVATAVSKQFGIPAEDISVSLDQPAELRVNALQARLVQTYASANAAFNATPDASSWALQANFADRYLQDPKDAFAATVLNNILTDEERSAGKSKAAALTALAEKIRSKYTEHCSKLLKLHGMYRQAKLRLDAAETPEDKEVVVNDFSSNTDLLLDAKRG